MVAGHAAGSDVGLGTDDTDPPAVPFELVAHEAERLERIVRAGFDRLERRRVDRDHPESILAYRQDTVASYPTPSRPTLIDCGLVIMR